MVHYLFCIPTSSYHIPHTIGYFPPFPANFSAFHPGSTVPTQPYLPAHTPVRIRSCILTSLHMVHTLECYICYKHVERHKYTHHVGSYVAGNNTGTPRSDLPFPAFGYPAYSIPPHSQARTPQEHVYATPIVRDQSIDRGGPVARPGPTERYV